MENQFISQLGSADLQSYILCLQAYQKSECYGEDIMYVGFNKYSGYVYITLENGIQIASCFGNSVDYIINDYDTGDEEFFDTYEDAINHLELKSLK